MVGLPPTCTGMVTGTDMLTGRDICKGIGTAVTDADLGICMAIGICTGIGRASDKDIETGEM